MKKCKVVLLGYLNEQEQQLVDKIIKRAKIECIKCVIWDEQAALYEKSGMCKECCDKYYATFYLPDN